MTACKKEQKRQVGEKPYKKTDVKTSSYRTGKELIDKVSINAVK